MLVLFVWLVKGRGRTGNDLCHLFLFSISQASYIVFFTVPTMRSSSPRFTRWLNYSIVFFLIYVFLISILIRRCIAGNCLKQGSRITDDGKISSTLLSSNNIFELGFFSPDGSTKNSRYLGIWYHTQSSQKTVVWVANRDRPLLGSNGYLTITDGHAKLLYSNDSTYWSTDAESDYVSSNTNEPSPNELISVGHYSLAPSESSTGKTPPSIRKLLLCLSDSGNLIFDPRGLEVFQKLLPPLWQSFDHPTDTFLPGMLADGSVNLTSWQSYSTPAHGNFTLQLHQDILIIFKEVFIFWTNANTPKPKQLSALLASNNTISAHNNSRLLIHFTGQVQLWTLDSSKGWTLTWQQPKDRCSFDNVCGNFGSCNSNNGLLCKCLPGFSPDALSNWTAGDFSGGCSANSDVCGRNSSDHDIFLRLPMMTVDYPLLSDIRVQDCKVECLNNCNCVAYSCGADNCSEIGAETNCTLWKSTSLTGLQEEYTGPAGITLFVRTTELDIASISRSCGPCGTYIIPYPLSTASTCGDPSYLYFHCNASSGQVGFTTPRGTFRVTSTEAKAFSIQVLRVNTCEAVGSMVLSIEKMPFNVANCSVVSNQPSVEIDQPFIEVKISWQPPLEPICNVSSDCRDWPHSICRAGNGGKLRCVCAARFKWRGSDLKCTRERFPIKILIACIAGALAIMLAGIVFVYKKSTTARRTGSAELLGDDSELIDVPFFEWGSILAATNNFADANRLGIGGFGSVYKGIFPDGNTVAVKRLSSASVQGLEEFRTEVVLIAKLQHRNLVRLLGYCVKADEKILVYEYMPNGSLDSCLFDHTSSVNLDWGKRFNIIFGIARGLLYLHQDSRLRIIHRDLKPSNVLLDEDLNPKISDFGIARIVEGKRTEGSTSRVVGTYGYMSPEYAYEGVFSVKSDVYSFGVVLLETVSGKRNSRSFMLLHGVSLLVHAWRLWTADRGLDLVDRELKDTCNQSEALKCICVGLLCVQEDPSDRPNMSSVAHMLSNGHAGLPSPGQPAFSSRKPPLETGSSSSAVDSSSIDMLTFSTVGR